MNMRRTMLVLCLLAATASGPTACAGEIVSPPRPTASTCVAANAADMAAAGFLQCTCPSVPATPWSVSSTRRMVDSQALQPATTSAISLSRSTRLGLPSGCRAKTPKPLE